MTFAVGIAFQFPLVLILLIKIGILNVTKLRANRRLVLVILMVSAALITPGGDPVSLCILTIPLYILYELAIITGSMIEVRKKRKEWSEWDESIQGPRPEKPPAREKGMWILYASIIIIIGALSIFAYQNKKLIEPWVESFRKFGQFSDEEKGKKINTIPPTSTKEDTFDSVLPSVEQKEFLLQLNPVDTNISFENNQSLLFRAKVIERD
jgi:hypothetical protein